MQDDRTKSEMSFDSTLAILSFELQEEASFRSENKNGCLEAKRLPQKNTKRLDRTDIFVNENDFVLL